MPIKSLVVVLAACMLPAKMAGQGGQVSASARSGIDAGNQAWIDGVKTGNIAMIIATYAGDAVDCGPTGECFRGANQIEQRMRTQLGSLGLATSAEVHSWGATQQGDFVYEWGEAEATYSGGKKLVEKYLTAWRKQHDGRWRIFRNLVIPEK